jgi:hypothetical protein
MWYVHALCQVYEFKSLWMPAWAALYFGKLSWSNRVENRWDAPPKRDPIYVDAHLASHELRIAQMVASLLAQGFSGVKDDGWIASAIMDGLELDRWSAGLQPRWERMNLSYSVALVSVSERLHRRTMMLDSMADIRPYAAELTGELWQRIQHPPEVGKSDPSRGSLPTGKTSSSASADKPQAAPAS